MHVVAAKQPFDEVWIFGWLDQQIVFIAHNGSNCLKKRLTHQHVQPDTEALLEGRDQGLQFLPAFVNHGCL